MLVFIAFICVHVEPQLCCYLYVYFVFVEFLGIL